MPNERPPNGGPSDGGSPNGSPSDGGSSDGHRRALEAALVAEGLPARVRAEGRLALLSAPPETFASAAARASATRLAREHGFTHAALVLADDPTGGAR